MAIPSTGAVSFSTIQTEFGGSNPIGLNEYYAGGAYVAAGTTGTNGAVPSSGAICVNKFHGTTAVVQGQIAYTTPGCYTWVAPSGVTNVSVVAIGGGGAGWPGCSRAGGGGGLGYKNNQSVTPGGSYGIQVGRGGIGANGYPPASNNGIESAFRISGGGIAVGNFGTGARNGFVGGTYTGDGGGNGGNGGTSGYPGGGGAGGYSGAGGAGTNTTGNSGSGGGGGGGGGGTSGLGGGGGGGTGLLGQGTSGAGGGSSSGGGGGSSGSTGGGGSIRTFPCPCCGPFTQAIGGPGGAYGGGGGGGCTCMVNAAGGGGAVRIIWPGTTRQFPSTNTGNL